MATEAGGWRQKNICDVSLYYRKLFKNSVSCLIRQIYEQVPSKYNQVWCPPSLIQKVQIFKYH